MDRRRFIQSSALGGLGYVLLGCGKGKKNGGTIIGPEGSSGETSSGGSSGGSASSWDKYVPQVNDDPYFRPEYFAATDTTDSIGTAGFFYDGHLVPFQVVDAGNRNFINGLNATLFMEFKTGTSDLMITDPQRRYMPRVIGLPPSFGGFSKISLQQSLEGSLLEVPPKGWFPKISGSIRGSKISAYLPNPSYNKEYEVDALPGIVYRGHWSIEDLVKVTNLAEKASLVLIPIDGGATYNVLSEVGDIGEDLIDFVDWINEKWPESKKFITPDKQFIPIYSGHGGLPEHLIVALSSNRKTEEDIRYLFPINEGNSWTYSDGRQTETIRVTGKKRVKGKQVVAVNQTSGIEEYFGFDGNSWNYYGFNFPSLGEIFFEPALKIGDNGIRTGSRFQTSSKVLSGITGLSGTAREDYHWTSREDVLLSDKTPYGDCFKIKETFSFELAKGGDKISEIVPGERWIAKNVGPVKFSVSGKTAELVDYESVSRAGPSQSSSKVAPFSDNPSLSGFSPLPKEFIESLKKLI